MSPVAIEVADYNCSLVDTTGCSHNCYTVSIGHFIRTNTGSNHIAAISRINTVTNHSFASIDRSTASLVGSRLNHIRCNSLVTTTIHTLEAKLMALFKLFALYHLPKVFFNAPKNLTKLV